MAEPTLRQEKAARLYVESISGKEGIATKSKRQILTEAGYSKEMIKNPKKVFETEGFREAVMSKFRSAGITEDKIADKLNWLLDGASEGNHIATTNAIKEIAKITGLYAPTKTENKTDIEVNQTIKHDSGDYLEFLKQKNQTREVIEGEIVDEQ